MLAAGWNQTRPGNQFSPNAAIGLRDPLDEPTSAINPWAEADWLERFRKLAAGRPAILITHRLTTAIQTDVIHVMEEGRIVESGSHEELLRRNGRYAESWSSQLRDAETIKG